MNATNKLLDMYAKSCYAKLDKEIAERLHVKHSTVANWKAGRAHPDANSIEKMANAIGEPLGPWLAQIEADRARTPANKKVWLRLAQTLGASALLIAAIAATPQAKSSPTSAESWPVYCVKSWLRRLRHALSEAQEPLAA